MRVHAFIHRHYSPDVGESPIGHAVAITTGLLLMAVGAGLVASVVFGALGSVVGLVGVMLFAGGMFAHIQSPLKFHDLMDAIVTLTGAAIAGTFALAILAVAMGFGMTALFEIGQWLIH